MSTTDNKKYLVMFDWCGSAEHQAFPSKEEAKTFIETLKLSPHTTTQVLAEVLEIHEKTGTK